MREKLKKAFYWVLSVVVFFAMLPLTNIASFAADDSLVESITVADVKILQGDRLVDTGYGYRYDVAPTWEGDYFIKVVLKDGTVIEGDYSDIFWEVYYATGSSVLEFYAPDQPQSMNKDELWDIGSHTAMVSLGDYEGTYNVIICENPIESISVEDVRVIEHTNGYWGYDGNIYLYNTHDQWLYDYTITMKNGNQYRTNSYQELGDLDIPELEDFTGLYTQIIEAEGQQQGLESPWLPNHDYQLTATFAGVSDDFLWKIEETPVEKITVSGTTITEHTNGDWNSDPGGSDRYFHYWIYTPNDYVLTMKNGNTYSSNQYVPELYGFLNLGWYDIEANQSFENPWVAGDTYPVKGSYAGVTTEWSIRIVSSPIQQVIVEDIRILENYNGYYVNPGTENEYYYYYIDPSTYTVVLNDGTQYNFTSNNHPYVPELADYYFNIKTLQTEEFHFEAKKTYSVLASYGGVDTSYHVTVDETPVAEFNVENVTIRQGIDSLSSIPLNYTVTMKNGNQYSTSGGYSPGEIPELSPYSRYGAYISQFFNIDYSIYEESRKWEAGTTHSVKATYAGVETTFQVSVIDNPIKNITIEDDQLTLVKNVDGQYDSYEGRFRYQVSPYLRGLLLNVTYIEDGQELNGTFTLDELSSKFNTSYSYEDNQWNRPWTETGVPYPVVISFAGFDKTVYVTLIETEASSVNWGVIADAEINTIAPNGVWTVNVAKAALTDSTPYAGYFLETLMPESDDIVFRSNNLNTVDNVFTVSACRKFGPDGSYVDIVKSYELSLNYAKDNSAKKAATDEAFTALISNSSVSSYGQSVLIIEDAEALKALEGLDSYTPYEITSHVERIPQAASIINSGFGIKSRAIGGSGGMRGPIPADVSSCIIGISKDNVYYTTGRIGTMLRSILYIPSETEDSVDAFVDAAQVKIDSVLGNGKAVIAYKGIERYASYPSPDNYGLDWSPLVCTEGILQDGYFNQFEITFLDDDGTAKFTAPFNILREPQKVTYNERIYAADRYGTAKATGDRYKKITGTNFENVVVACGTNFPDALAGGFLAKVKNAPILLVTNSNENDIVSYIKANMNPNGTVYLLGGTGVVSSGFENKVKSSNLKVKRLGGADRYATNIAILTEAGVNGQAILVCTGTGYADSLSASAVGLPILLVGDTINEQQKQFLRNFGSSTYYLIGGPGAVKESVRTSLQSINSYFTIERIYGQTRYETSTEVAKRFFPKTDNVLFAYAQNFPDGLSGGPLAMKIKAPILLVDSYSTAAASTYVKKSGASGSITLGGPTLISDVAIKKILGK